MTNCHGLPMWQPQEIELLGNRAVGETFQSASFREATASARRPPDHQHLVSRVPEKSYSCTHQQVGRASEPFLGWRPHQVLVVQDTVPIVERNRFCIVRFIGAGRLPFLWKSMIVVAQKLKASR